MSLQKLFHFVGLAFLLAACQHGSDADMVVSDVVVDYTVVVEEQIHILDRRNALAIGSEGQVYVTDVQNYAVRKYGPDGALVAQVGSRGEGPGEFTSGPAMITYDSGRIVVGEDRGSRTQYVFSEHLEYIDRFTLDGFHLDPAAHGDALFFPSINIGDNGDVHFEVVRRDAGNALTILFPVGEQISGIGDFRGMTFSTGFLSTDGNVMAYVYSFQNAIELHAMDDLEAGPVRTRIPGDFAPIVWEKRQGTVGPPEVASAVASQDATMDQGLVYVLGASLAPGHAQQVFIFNRSGAHVGTVELPHPAHAIDVQDGHLAYLGMNGMLGQLKLKLEALAPAV